MKKLELNKKGMQMVAIIVFILGLGINVKMSLSDPFSTVSLEVLAQEMCVGTNCDSSGENNGTGGTGTQNGGSLFNYDEKKTDTYCEVTWTAGPYSETVQGTYYICVSGNDWFCNKGCYTPGDSPS